MISIMSRRSYVSGVLDSLLGRFSFEFFVDGFPAYADIVLHSEALVSFD
jgi:hypothetical protein